jgi:type I restriction enzyme M protein
MRDSINFGRIDRLKDKMAADKQNNSDSFEQKLWKAADKLRKNIDAAEYKHIVLGLIFLKYISDAFEALHQKLRSGEGDYAKADPEVLDDTVIGGLRQGLVS